MRGADIDRVAQIQLGHTSIYDTIAPTRSIVTNRVASLRLKTTDKWTDIPSYRDEMTHLKMYNQVTIS